MRTGEFRIKQCKRKVQGATITNRSPSQTPRGRGNRQIQTSTDRSKAVVPVLVLLSVALWFILRGDLFYVLPCVIVFLFFQSFQLNDYLAWGSES